MNLLMEMIYWIKIFLSPVFIAVLVIAGLYSLMGHFNYWYFLLFIPASVVGIIMAERARKKHGTGHYYSKPMNTPDIKDTWEENKE
ncbi:MAG: hypothetical protein H6550_00415 [Chitinophagales bacterium]|nr:hypothetical protein [Chitinophagales bacterium]